MANEGKKHFATKLHCVGSQMLLALIFIMIMNSVKILRKATKRLRGRNLEELPARKRRTVLAAISEVRKRQAVESRARKTLLQKRRRQKESLLALQFSFPSIPRTSKTQSDHI